MFSVKQGFVENIPAEFISHPANCRVLVHLDNQKKNTKSCLSIEELKQRILEWNKKYVRETKVDR
jgi:hypothetical protein